MMRGKTINLLCILALFLLSAPLFSSYRGQNLTRAEIEALFAAEETARNEYLDYISDIRASFADQMRKELNLRCYGWGGQMRRTIKTLTMQFYADRRATIEEARALQLLVMEKFVDAINAHEKLRPFLKVQPFTHKQIAVTIKFRGVNGNYDDGSLYFISNTSNDANPPHQNQILYYARDPFTCDIVDLFKESYDDAVKRRAAIPIKNLAVYQPTEKEAEIDRCFFDFRKEMWNRHQLECWAIGGEMTGSIDEIGAKFVTLHPATQEEARTLLLGITHRLLQVVNENPILRPYFAQDPFPVERLKLRLCFKKKGSYGTYRDGTMESVTLEGGKVTYFQETPFKNGELPQSFFIEVPEYATESYQEALEISKEKPQADPFYKQLMSKITPVFGSKKSG